MSFIDAFVCFAGLFNLCCSMSVFLFKFVGGHLLFKPCFSRAFDINKYYVSKLCYEYITNIHLCWVRVMAKLTRIRLCSGKVDKNFQ